MLSLLELVSQNQPHFQTHQALLVLGFQNDFLRPDGKLPVNTRSGFVDRITALVPTFRKLSANVIWVQTLYEADRLANDPATGEGDAVVVGGLVDGVESSTDDDDDIPKDLIPPAQSRSSKHKQRALDLLKRVSTRRRTVPREASSHHTAPEEDEELFLRQSKTGPACMPNTPGAEFVDSSRAKIEPSDTVVQTTNYSAFQGTSLLLILRARLVTELYICGCITNVSVLATVIDAARHGIKINVVGDCLGFRKQSRHDVALKRMVEFFDANVVTSAEVIDRNHPEEKHQQRPSQASSTKDEETLEKLVDRMKLKEASPTQRTNSREIPRPAGESPAITINGRQRNVSDASIAGSRTTIETKLSDEQFAERLAQGVILPSSDPHKHGKEPNLVKSKIRMRSRSSKSKTEEDKKAKTESNKRGEEQSESSAPRATSKKTAAQPPKSPKAETPAVDKPRPAAITKAESSDKLRGSSPKGERSLKSSASQPALSSGLPDSKDKTSASRVRLALSRSPKSDSNKELSVQLPPQPQPRSQPPHSPTKTGTATSGSTSASKMGKKLQSLATFPVLGPGDRVGEGDSRIIHDFFPTDLRHPTDPSKPLKDLIFQQLYNEVRWQKMLHQQGEVPRLVCCQGEFGADGSMPVYRHPTDQTLPLLHFSPKVQVIRNRAEKLVGHPLNHVLIQLYRSGSDYISEHSDKTLDIVRGSSIVNVSFGAQRTMRLRTKKSAKAGELEGAGERETQRVALPHNSMFILGLESNEKWLHGIMADKRPESERSEAEAAYSGIRISLTFRQIGTFLDARNSVIWGQGATCKDQRNAQDIINDDEEETERMVRAFSKENHSTEFDWEEWYGDGFDLLHLHAPPDDLPIFFASNNPVENNMVKIFLSEAKIEHKLLEAPTLEKQYELNRQVSFRDNDVNHTETNICYPTLVYLDRYYPLDRDSRSRNCTATSYDLILVISSLRKYWVNREVPTYYQDFVNVIETLEDRYAMGPGSFIAGRRFSIGDCAMWPAVDDLVENWEEWSEERFPKLTEYYKMVWKKKKSVQMLKAKLPTIRKTAKQEEDSAEEDE